MQAITPVTANIIENGYSTLRKIEVLFVTSINNNVNNIKKIKNIKKSLLIMDSSNNPFTQYKIYNAFHGSRYAANFPSISSFLENVCTISMNSMRTEAAIGAVISTNASESENNDMDKYIRLVTPQAI